MTAPANERERREAFEFWLRNKYDHLPCHDELTAENDWECWLAATDEALELAAVAFRLVRNDEQKTWWVEAHVGDTILRVADAPDNKDGEAKGCAQLILNQITFAIRKLKGGK